MINTETHYEMTIKDDYNEWNEKIPPIKYRDGTVEHVTNDNMAIGRAQELVADFNRSLKSGETPRIITCVQRVETKVIDLTDFRSEP